MRAGTTRRPSHVKLSALGRGTPPLRRRLPLLIKHPQAMALENASRILKPGGAGTLAVADFFLRGSKDFGLQGLWRASRELETTLQRLWFKQVQLIL